MFFKRDAAVYGKILTSCTNILHTLIFRGQQRKQSKNRVITHA